MDLGKMLKSISFIYNDHNQNDLNVEINSS